MKQLLTFLKPYKKECIVGPVFKLMEAILELLLPTIMALIINNGVNKGDTSYILKMGGLMLLMAVFGFCSSLVCQYYAARVSQGFGTSLRNHIFKHILSFSYSEIDKIGTSSLINRVTNDVNQLQVAVAMLIRLVIRAPFICIGAIVMAMILDFKLSLVFLGTVPIFVVILYFIITRTSALYRKYQQKLDNVGMTVRQNLSGIRVIRAFANTQKEKERFSEVNNDLTSVALRASKISVLLNPLTSFVMNASIIVILWLGSIHINTGRLSQGEIIAFVNYLTQILVALIVISNLVIIFTRAYASAGRINEILSISPSITENKGSCSNNTRAPAIEYRNVSFGYSSTGDKVLEDITVTIHHGETIGIIGGTGSGKSTFVSLIPRFYDVQQGEILVDGVNVKEYPFEELRKKIGYVPQKAELFSGTIADNIRWGRQDAADGDVRVAAMVAQAHEFISSMPDGYNTMVSRGGLNFSGGQKQRLTIARALVGRPEILILDDSSSALDFSTDSKLRSSLKQNSRSMTTLIVSQRISTIKSSSKIIVFDDGRITGIGTHDELMSGCEVYREIYASQFSNGEAVL